MNIGEGSRGDSPHEAHFGQCVSYLLSCHSTLWVGVVVLPSFVGFSGKVVVGATELEGNLSCLLS